jgi:hypothetical protein
MVMTKRDAAINATGRQKRHPRHSPEASALAAQFAAALGVSLETYRIWDAGRRAVPEVCLDKARAFAAANDPNRLRSLQELAHALGVHVRTLRESIPWPSAIECPERTKVSSTPETVARSASIVSKLSRRNRYQVATNAFITR